MQTPHFTVSQFIEVLNQTLDYAFPVIELEGEVSNFKTSKGKWGFFDLKDEKSTVSCFIPLFNLHVPLEDGTKIVTLGRPKLTNFGRFSFTVQKLMPKGEGNIKKAFDLLKEKLTKEGLFDPARKRPLPDDLKTIGVISSTSAAGYADFCKILNNRWGGLTLKVANCGVQGLSAAGEIIQAIEYFNEQEPVDVIAIVRGGGSKDDLAVFNDEELARKIASSKIPVITGIGHEIDESLADIAADLRASTPTNAAEILTRDKHAESKRIHDSLKNLTQYLTHYIDTLKSTNSASLTSVNHVIEARIESAQKDLQNTQKLLESLNPETVLKQGYAILTGTADIGNVVKITTYDKIIKAKVTHVNQRENK
ncbi:exodeoxyribonuclease VII large subunit [Candidatus Saccharibacteria bacterium]|nr:exodeoxyribonuclease VII large subunit [Candidatus Saccharibacteria bacterium]